MKLAIVALFLLPACAQAQVYKCVAADGSTSYATVPCAEGSGETTRIIEPVPPSGALNIPVQEQPASEDPASTPTDATGQTSTVSGIPDSDASAREQKRTLMREEAEQHKKDLYDQDVRKKEQRRQEELYRRNTQ